MYLLTDDDLLCNKNYLPALPDYTVSHCVYLLFTDDEIVYVGQTAQLRVRLLNWRGKKIGFNAWSYVPCDPGELDEVENTLIACLRPRLNKAYLPKCVNPDLVRSSITGAGEVRCFGRRRCHFTAEGFGSIGTT
jgi:hypothetical protein